VSANGKLHNRKVKPMTPIDIVALVFIVMGIGAFIGTGLDSF